MNNPIEISELARAAASSEYQQVEIAKHNNQQVQYGTASEKEWATKNLQQLKPLGYYVQLAINNVTADRDKVIEEYKQILETADAIHKSISEITGIVCFPVQMSGFLKTNLDAVNKRCDQLQQQVRELEKDKVGLKCTCGEPHISHRVVHRYDGKPCYISDP